LSASSASFFTIGDVPFEKFTESQFLFEFPARLGRVFSKSQLPDDLSGLSSS
jgi:hypothetical protein